MALFTPSESPAVVVREIDLTGGVPNVQSTTGAVVGNFQWGPVLQRTAVSNEAELVEAFGAPSDTTNVDFLSATQFLRYSSSMQVVRNVDSSATSAFSLQGTTGHAPAANSSTVMADPLVLNKTNFDARQASLEATLDSDQSVGYGFIARYPGFLGSSLAVSFCPADSAGTVFTNWRYVSSFDAAPVTTSFASVVKQSTNDEVHAVVVDQAGLITGTRGTILETYPNCSILTDAKGDDGQSLYLKDVINEKSQYVYMLNFDTELEAKGAAGASALLTNYGLDSCVDRLHDLSSGVNSGALGTSDVLEAFDLFEDRDQVEVDFLIAPGMSARADQTTIVNDLVATAASVRKDCVAVASPARTDVVGVTSDATKVTNVVTTADTFTNSSYLVADNNYIKVYDKYNDKYVEIPAASTVAGIMAATDFNRAPWFSPAGSRRGQMLGITALNYSPTKAQRDTLYKAGVNPIANIPGQGTLLFGDKTMIGRASAFDRINVRRLFLVLERAIGRAAEQVMFEFNDEFTRAEFVNIVEPVLREVQGRRGITDFRVVCDATNNTAAVIDRNEFKADIFIKPARSINYVTLSFVAVRTGVDFEEVVGTV